jgi:hypothetical protein
VNSSILSFSEEICSESWVMAPCTRIYVAREKMNKVTRRFQYHHYILQKQENSYKDLNSTTTCWEMRHNSWETKRNTWLASAAGDSRFLSSNLLLVAASPVSLDKFLSLWEEYECDMPLFDVKYDQSISLPFQIVLRTH